MSELRLVTLTLPMFRALAAEDDVESRRLLGMSIPDQFIETVDIWRFMISILKDHPENADWVMQAVVAGDVIVGNAGFKGAPVDGEIELGYRIAPDHRRRGHALAAVGLLLDRARREPDVDRVIARIAPDNDASVGVITRAGFVPDGEHVNPRWGRQLQFVHETPGPVT